MIELATEQSYEQIIAEAGARYEGENEQLVYFTDPATGSTLACRPEEVSVEFVREKMRKSRERFNPPDRNADYFAEIYFLMRVAFCRENMPDEILKDATRAAMEVIVHHQHEVETAAPAISSLEEGALACPNNTHAKAS